MPKTITQRVVKNLRGRGVIVLTHRQWGSVRRDVYAARRKKTREGGFGKFIEPADTVWQHITVTFDSGVLVGDFKVDVRTIERIGYERFGSGCSYNWLVDMKTGMVAVGQPLDAKGTHTVNDKGVSGFSYDQNLAGRAIAVLGMPGDQLSKKAEASIVHILGAMIQEGAITRGFDYEPHSLVAEKDCCCAPTRDKMPRIRETVAAQFGAAS